MGQAAVASGPDLAQGVAFSDVPAEGVLAGRVGDEPVLLARLDGGLVAIGGVCTHYGAALADGLVADGTIRCPLHHACFSLKTGAALKAPAFDPLPRWAVEVEGDRVFVRRREEAPDRPPAAGADVGDVLIVGGGAAGFACAEALRRLGHRGRILVLSADADPPCDRPNLSKDFLAGTAPDEWLPLRGDDFYRDLAIELRLDTRVASLDPAARTLVTEGGETLRFDRLLLATGAEPVRLPGLDGDDVHVLRSLADARALAARAAAGGRAVVLGSSFIGMEAAAALRARGVEVTIVSSSRVPFERVLGREVGGFFQALHERKGVRFRLGRKVAGREGRMVRLDDGERIEADFLLVGIGVRPSIALATAAGLGTEAGIEVDACLETPVPGIFAAGDAAAFPDPRDGMPIRIEHWVTAQRQGQVAAANMLGARERFADVPFFWTEQYGVSLRFVGRAPAGVAPEIEGDFAAGAFTARWRDGGALLASASVGRDLAALEDERTIERGLALRAAGTSAPPRHPMPADVKGGTIA